MDTHNAVNAFVDADRHIKAFRFVQCFGRSTGTVVIFKYPTSSSMLV